jgi:hypothetical protein
MNAHNIPKMASSSYLNREHPTSIGIILFLNWFGHVSALLKVSGHHHFYILLGGMGVGYDLERA